MLNFHPMPSLAWGGESEKRENSWLEMSSLIIEIKCNNSNNNDEKQDNKNRKRNKTHERQVMHSAINSLPPTDQSPDCP